MASTRGLSRVHVGEIVTPESAIRRTASLTLNVRRWLPAVVQTTMQTCARPLAHTHATGRTCKASRSASRSFTATSTSPAALSAAW